jgi:hypothetical protein
MSTAIEKMAAKVFGSYLDARGWAKVSALPSKVLKLDLAAVTKVGIEIPPTVQKLVKVYASTDMRYVYAQIEGEGTWRKNAENVLKDLPGMITDSFKVEEVAKQTESNVKWMVLGASALVIGIVGFMLWKSGSIQRQ